MNFVIETLPLYKQYPCRRWRSCMFLEWNLHKTV